MAKATAAPPTTRSTCGSPRNLIQYIASRSSRSIVNDAHSGRFPVESGEPRARRYQIRNQIPRVTMAPTIQMLTASVFSNRYCRPPGASSAELKLSPACAHRHIGALGNVRPAVIDAIQNEGNTPDQMDAQLSKRFDLSREADITKTFLSTQRTEIIWLIVDLDSFALEKSRLRVTCLVTWPGQDFRSKINKQLKGDSDGLVLSSKGTR